MLLPPPWSRYLLADLISISPSSALHSFSSTPCVLHVHSNSCSLLIIIIIIIIYLSWSLATCWPVPVSRIQKSLQMYPYHNSNICDHPNLWISSVRNSSHPLLCPHHSVLKQAHVLPFGRPKAQTVSGPLPITEIWLRSQDKQREISV